MGVPRRRGTLPKRVARDRCVMSLNVSAEKEAIKRRK